MYKRQELDIDEDELKYINGYISNLNNINGTSEPSIESAGLQHVSGTQALAFCRIRYTSGGDYKRTERHREVLTKILEKIETLPATSYPSLLSEILPMVNTSSVSYTHLLYKYYFNSLVNRSSYNNYILCLFSIYILF